MPFTNIEAAVFPLSKVKGVTDSLTNCTSSGGGHGSIGIHPISNPLEPSSKCISDQVLQWEPMTMYPVPCHKPPLYPLATRAGIPAILAIVVKIITYSEQEPSLASSRMKRTTSSIGGAPEPSKFNLKSGSVVLVSSSARYFLIASALSQTVVAEASEMTPKVMFLTEDSMAKLSMKYSGKSVA